MGGRQNPLLVGSVPCPSWRCSRLFPSRGAQQNEQVDGVDAAVRSGVRTGESGSAPRPSQYRGDPSRSCACCRELLSKPPPTLACWGPSPAPGLGRAGLGLPARLLLYYVMMTPPPWND